MSSRPTPLHLFQGYGIELEYMIVSEDTLQVCPITDKLIFEEVGAYVSDVEFGDIAWSNELVLHVVELKTQQPVASLEGLYLKFQEHVQKINSILKKYNACLMPTGAHPLMDPFSETKLWPHEHNAVYEAYNYIFDCRGHGWANLQSTHLNLPFADDEQFGRLHAAIRMVLPLIPALSASSPVLEGTVTGLQDTRLEVYRNNQNRIPSIAGMVVPEQVYTKAAYEEQILQRIYADVAPYDKEGVLQEEFLNSRGAIARFERNAIEIRLLDIQECPLADIAIVQAVVRVLKALVAEKWVPLDELKKWHEGTLSELLFRVIREGQEAQVRDAAYLTCFGYTAAQNATVGQLWQHLVKETTEPVKQTETDQALAVILSEGNLSCRILKALGTAPSTDKIKEVYRLLAKCLQQGGMFTNR